MLIRSLLILSLASVAAFADVTAPSNAPTAAQASRERTLPLHRLRGPFASVEDYCARRRRDDATWVRSCDIVRRLPHTAAAEIRMSDGRRALLLAVEWGEHGDWWIDEGRRDSVGIFFDEGNPARPSRFPVPHGRGTFVLLGIDDGGGPARMRAVQSGWSLGTYYCFLFEVHCYFERKGDAYCTEPLPLAGRDECDLGDARGAHTFDASRWDWRQEFLERGDGSGIDIRRGAWRKFPTDLSDLNLSEWVRSTARTARALAGHYH